MKQIINPTVRAYSTHIKTIAPKRISPMARGFGILRITVPIILGIAFLQLSSLSVLGQCATSGTTTLSANPNTYYPGNQASVSAGSTSIKLSKAGKGGDFGSSPISIAAGDLVLVIQMQGVQIMLPSLANDAHYGGNTSGVGSGFLTTNLLAGNMEFAIATNSVAAGTGGTLNIAAGLTYSYTSSAYGTDGQYKYQVIRVPENYDIQLTGTISTPKWNGSIGGVTAINAANQLDFNGQIITAAGAGFRGGAGRVFSGQSGLTQNDFYSLATQTANGSKGEGIAGTPRYVNFNDALVNTGAEGYPGGSYARGAPGNAGGGGTDSHPVSNDQNSGGGGGGNGGSGGTGGNGWYSFGYTGGRGGFRFATTNPNTTYYNPNRLIMGGGGGAGSTNDGTGTTPVDSQAVVLPEVG